MRLRDRNSVEPLQNDDTRIRRRVARPNRALGLSVSLLICLRASVCLWPIFRLSLRTLRSGFCARCVKSFAFPARATYQTENC
jgi:hypothetical protein